MRLVLAAAIAFSVAAAHAEAPPQPKKQQVVLRYRTLEKMLRRFSTVAGDARTRG